MSFGPRTSCSSLLVYLICIKLLRCQVLTVDRNIIKFNLTNREMSLQPPGLFAEAHDVVYFNISRGRDAAVNFQSPKETCIRFPDPGRKRGFYWGDDLHGNAPACQRSTYLIYSTFFARRQQRCGLRFIPVLWQFVAIIAQANEVSNAAFTNSATVAWSGRWRSCPSAASCTRSACAACRRWTCRDVPTSPPAWTPWRSCWPCAASAGRPAAPAAV